MLHTRKVQASAVFAAGVALMVVTIAAQQPRLRFDSTTIVAAGTGGAAPTGTPETSLFRRSNVTVAGLIQFAYEVGSFELLGGPDWVRVDRFDVTGSMRPGASDADVRQMVQSLLAEGFALRLDREVRDMSYYVLRASADGSLGPRLQRCDPSAPRSEPAPMRLPPDAVPMTAACVSMSEIAKRASTAVAAPVVDRSDIKGLWSYRITVQQPKVGESVGPLVASAFREQLGLDLHLTKGRLPVMVIQSVARPKAH